MGGTLLKPYGTLKTFHPKLLDQNAGIGWIITCNFLLKNGLGGIEAGFVWCKDSRDTKMHWAAKDCRLHLQEMAHFIFKIIFASTKSPGHKFIERKNLQHVIIAKYK